MDLNLFLLYLYKILALIMHTLFNQRGDYEIHDITLDFTVDGYGRV